MGMLFKRQHLFILMLAIAFAKNAFAAAFQVWEQDSASMGNYHAGRAAIADDASTGFYNPAGLIRIKNQQIIGGGIFLLTDDRYRGNVSLGSNNPTNSPQLFFKNAPVTAQGGTSSFIPAFHYAAPWSDTLVFGISYVIPFSFKTDYGTNSLLRYATTFNQLQIIDIAPSFGIALNKKLSVGFGLDFEHIAGEFDQNSNVVNQTQLFSDTLSKNSGNGNAYGFHAGALYQFNDKTRIGLSYHSAVIHHFNGTSIFYGPLANSGAGATQTGGFLQSNITLPPTTSLSVFHTINSKWDAMGTVSYTKWNVFKQLVFQNAATNIGGTANNVAPLVIQQGYQNAWNYSVGANYHATDKLLLRTGIGFDQSPVRDSTRNVSLPDNDRVALALGGHYQVTKSIGFDLAWTHFFVADASINQVQTFGDQVVTTNGTVKGNTDIYGFQVKWDIF